VAKPKPKRRTLNPERVAAAALELIDEKGLDAFSTRALGARLNVEGMALYRHYPNIDALLDAVAERLILEVPIPQGPGDWQERVRRFARAYRQLALRHPRSYVLLATRRFNTPRSLQWLDELLDGLLDEGFSAREAVEVFRTVGAFCGGASLDELAGLGLKKRKSQQALPGARALGQTGRWLAPEKFGPVFEAGLEAVIAGLAARVR